MGSLLGSIQHNLPELDQKLAMGAVEALISCSLLFDWVNSYDIAQVNYLDLLADDSNRGKYKLERFTLSDYMRLDASAFRALNI